MSMKYGVPRTSTLGPILFLLYINDLNFVFNKAVTIHFADDIHLSYASKKLSTLESVMNYQLKRITEWLRSIFHSKTKKGLDEITRKINKI